jgi:hypothetical protein
MISKIKSKTACVFHILQPHIFSRGQTLGEQARTKSMIKFIKLKGYFTLSFYFLFLKCIINLKYIRLKLTWWVMILPHLTRVMLTYAIVINKGRGKIFSYVLTPRKTWKKAWCKVSMHAMIAL